MAKIAKWKLLAIIILLLMAVFPTLPSIADRIAERRITQRGMLPGASRRRFQPGSEREIVAFVAPQGEAGGDFTDIQEAVNFANNSGGGAIFIKSGTYKISSHITLYSNIELIGQDNDTTILDFGGASIRLSAPGSSASHLTNIHISNIQLKDSIYEYGSIDMVYTDNYSINNCKFVNSQTTSGTDIYIEQATLGEVNNNYSLASRGFIVTNTVTGLILDKNTISDYTSASFGAAIRIDANTNVIISNNTITSDNASAGSGIWLINSDGTKVNKNSIALSGSSTDLTIFSQGADNCLITNNTLSSANSDGIILGYDTDSSDNNIIMGNNITAAKTAGDFAAIGVNLGDRNIIIGNYVVSGDYGVGIGGGVDRTTVIGNYLLGATTPLNDGGANTNADHNVVA